MKKSEIKVGGYYLASVNGKLVTVRVDTIGVGHYGVTNMKTGRKTRFKSAAKFREEVPVCDTCNKPFTRFRGDKPNTCLTCLEGEDRSSDPSLNDPKPEAEQRPDPTLAPTQPSGDTTVTPPTDPNAKFYSGNGESRAVVSALGRAMSQAGQAPGAKHLQVKALAGTGKTWTIVNGLVKVKGGTPTAEPSPQQAEVWRELGMGKADTVRVSAFNNSITNEMQGRLEKAGLHLRGVECKGVHSLGYAAVRKQFGYKAPSDDATKELVCQVLGVEPRNVRNYPGLGGQLQAAAKLVSLCKQTMTDPTPEGLDRLTSRYDVEIEGGKEAVYALVPEVLERAKTPGATISFDDMIWLPLVHDLPIFKVDVQVIDEAQDLNRMQQELIYRAGRRIVGVGDENQAIYGFAGADSESMSRMRDHLMGPSGQGCLVLPLTMTRRCGRAIVEEARRYVPEFEAHPSNCEGTVGHHKYTWKYPATGDRVEVPWEDTYGPHVGAGDMVLCRVNAPLVSECFRFLKRGIPATILGRNVGQGLIRLIEDSKANTTPDLVGWVHDWLVREQEKEAAKRFPSEGKLQNLQDRYDCVMAFTEGTTHAYEVTQKVRQVFADKRCPRCGKSYDVADRVCKEAGCGRVELELPKGVKFASVHKSKGLEAERVFFLKPANAGPRRDKMQGWELEQEDNLDYVGVTRAIKELYFVS